MDIPSGFGEFQIAFSSTGDPHVAQTSIGVAVDGVPSQTDVFNLYVDGLWGDLWHAIGSSSWQAIQVRLLVGAGSAPPVIVEATLADDGAQSSSACPPNVAVLLRKSTASGGRANRGRMYFPGPPEASINNVGVLDSTYKSDVQDAVDAVFGISTTGPIGPYYVLHANGDSPTLMTGFGVENVVATQRRRLVR